MSIWTYVNGTISFRGNKKDAKRIHSLVKESITGSEGPCEVSLIHNRMITGSDERRGFKRFKLERALYTLAFSGSLRDRMCDYTSDEIRDVIKTIISNYGCIEHVGITIRDGVEEIIFLDYNEIKVNYKNEVTISPLKEMEYDLPLKSLE